MTDKKIDQFTHLHVHTDIGSLLDGYDKVTELLDEVDRIGQKAVAITDHGSLSGIYDLAIEAKKRDITPIAGCEFYVSPSTTDRFSRTPTFLADGGRGDVAGRGSYTHLTILAENNIGLKNLFKLSLQASTDGFYQKARIDMELMEQYHEGLIATTGCPSSETQIRLRNNDYTGALAYAAKLVDIFGKDNVFVELMDHGMKQNLEREVRGGLLQIAKDLNLPLVATNDLHYAKEDDKTAHEHMLAIQTRAVMSEPADYDGGRRFAFEGGSYYVKSRAEMEKVFPDLPEALDNTMLIAERASFDIQPDDNLRPRIEIPEGYTEAEWLRKECFDGLLRRLPDKADNPEYVARLEMELDTLIGKGYVGYFLVTSDFIRWAKFVAQPPIPMGPGRGCLTAETNVLTPLGFKKITEVAIGDEVFNQYGKTEKVTNVFEYDCDEELLEIKAFFGRQGNVMTPDHKVLVSKANKVTEKTLITSGYRYKKEVNEPEWIRADEIKLGDLVVTPKIEYPNNLVGFPVEAVSVSAANTKYAHSVRNIAKSVNVARSTVMKYIANGGKITGPATAKIAEYFVANHLNLEVELEKRFKITTSKDYVEANYDLGKLIGLFASDGWIRKDRNTEVGFAQRTSEDEGEIPTLFDKVFGVTLNAYKSKTADLTQYTMNHKGIRSFFASMVPDYEYNAGTKHLNNDLFFSSEEFRQGLLDGLWYGDGSHKGKSSYTTVSPQLAEDVHMLLLSLGLPASLKKNIRKETRPEFNVSKREHYVEYKVTTAHNFDPNAMHNGGRGFDGKYTYYCVREINKVASPGKVYDFTMPETHSYLTDSYVVHNSAAGSLVAFCLDITDADPIRFDLLFERFINPERDSPPDIDIDVQDLERGRLIDYVKEKYGKDHVALVSTFGKIGAKTGLKDIVRILEKPYAVGDALSKAMPAPVFGKEMKLSEIYNPDNDRYSEAEDFRNLVEKEDLQEVVDAALKLEGRTRSMGVHAAAVVISSQPVVNTIPMYMRQVDGELITQWDYPTAEAIGLLKMDFLGLRNLGVIRDAVAHIKRTRGIELNVTEIMLGSLDDPKTYKMLQAGDTLGVFQLDGGGLRKLLKQLKPTQFLDISAVLSLYRPGPMGVGAHEAYARRKNGLEVVSPIHPEFKDSLAGILEESYGLCVSGDTKIWDATTGKLVRIDSVAEKVHSGNFFTFSVNDLGQVESKRVTHWVNTGIKPIFEVISNDGRLLRVSGDHPVLTLDGYKPASELVAGVDYIASSGQQMSSEFINDFSVEEARFAGYMIGDGYINLYQNTFTNSSVEILDHVQELGEKLFDDVHIYSIPRFRKGIHYTNHMQFSASAKGTGAGLGVRNVYSTTFKMNKWFKDRLGYSEKTLSRDKFIPDVIFGASSVAMKNFIAGLWDTDGHVNEKFAFFKTISKSLAFDLQLLFDRLGMTSQIITSASYKNEKYGDTIPYGVYVYDKKFWDEIVPLLVHNDKKAIIKLDKIRSASTQGVSQKIMKRDMSEIMLNDSDLSLAVKNKIKVNNQVSLKSIHAYLKQKNLAHLVTHTQTRSDSSFVRTNTNTQSYLENFASSENVFNSKQRWNLIKTITISEPEPVYDITVEDNHNFYANGVLVHNCIYQEQVQRIAQVVAGYSLAQADILRRAMGKKKRYIIDAEFIPFSEGARKNGYSDEAIKALWDILVPFADYAFNKSLVGSTKVFLSATSQHTNQEGSVTVKELYDRLHAPLADKRVARKGNTEAPYAGLCMNPACAEKGIMAIPSGRGRCHACKSWVTKFRNSGLKIRAMKDGRIKVDRIKDIVDHGVLPVYKMVLANGNSLTCTMNHKNLTAEGWKPLREVKVGTLIAVEGSYEQKDNSTGHGRNWHSDADAYTAASVNSGRNQHFLHGNYSEYVRNIALLDLSRCANCGKENDGQKHTIEIAHLDSDRSNSSIDNLKPLCNSCHKTYDIENGTRPKRMEKGFPVNYSPVVSIEYVGEEQTYDLEMAGKEHNFVANGIVTHNSHTVAYGLTSYLTAFLKANYPAEFMSALLSSVADDTDKTALYLDECKHLGIRVFAPDVSKSTEDYVPHSETEIYFGLKAIRGMGSSTAEEIVRARGGRAFTSLSDFMNRMPSKLVNKRVLEGLTQGGGFDAFGFSRKSLINAFPDMLKALAKARKAKDSGLVSLFDDDEEDLLIFDILDIGEYPKLEKLRNERHALGLYVSDHPLNGLQIDSQADARVYDLISEAIPASEGWGNRNAKPIKISGIVTSLEKKRNKAGAGFAVGVFEDTTGGIPFAMFSKVYDEFGDVLTRDGVFQFTGQHRKREGEDEVQFIVESVKPLDFGENGHLNVKVRLTARQWMDGRDNFLKRLRNHQLDKGSLVQMSILDGKDVHNFALEDVAVRRSPALIADIRELFGIDSIGTWRLPD